MKAIKFRLIVMNFLEFAVWGAYLTSMGSYLFKIGMLIPGCIFIAAIPEKSRYSFSDDPKGGHNYDETYYHQKIIDIIHFGA